jgi:hypothetical protein
MVVINVMAIRALTTWPTMRNSLIGCERLWTICKCGINVGSAIKCAHRIEIKVGQGWTGLAHIRCFDSYHDRHSENKESYDSSSANHPDQPAVHSRRTRITILAKKWRFGTTWIGPIFFGGCFAFCSLLQHSTTLVIKKNAKCKES